MKTNEKAKEKANAKSRNSMSRFRAVLKEVGKAVHLLVFVVKRAGWQRQITYQYFFSSEYGFFRSHTQRRKHFVKVSTRLKS